MSETGDILAAETQAHQVLLEGHRAYPDNESIYKDWQKAKAAMEIAWMEHNKTTEM